MLCNTTRTVQSNISLQCDDCLTLRERNQESIDQSLAFVIDFVCNELCELVLHLVVEAYIDNNFLSKRIKYETRSMFHMITGTCPD